MSKKKIVVFDLCGTLYSSNTTFDFVDYVLDRSFSCYLLKTRLFKYGLIVLGRLLGKDLYRKLYIYQLKGLPADRLRNKANEFVETFLSYKKVKEVHSLLSRSMSDGDFVYICSASLDVIVSAVCKEINVDNWMATELVYDPSGLCRGKIKNDLLGKKADAFQSNLELVVTDNISDLSLLKKAKRKFILSKMKNINFWRSNGMTVDLTIK